MNSKQTAGIKSAIVPEIQGLRSVAVLLVLAYHIWPQFVTGGYVGVDVFFVISGYLITGLLLRELEKSGRISLATFYARRIRRLLPAATFVLLCTAALSILALPRTRWVETSYEIIASALYVENWWLSVKQVDYLVAGYASPVQHYWSLSIEEQFYILWPITLLLASKIGKKAIIAFIVLTISFSFSWSIFASTKDAGLAYFDTFTRMWELALGGLIAIIPKPSSKKWLIVSGMFAILLSGFIYDETTLFPGHAALLPTLGAVFIIMSAGGNGIVSGFLSSRPMQYMGGISYSLYLWHWPVIIFYGMGRTLNFLDGITIFIASIILSDLSKRFIEDPFRQSKPLLSRKRYSFGMAAGCIAVSALSAGIVNGYSDSKNEIYALTKEEDKYHPGALVFRGHAEAETTDFIPKPVNAKNDIPSVYKDGCHADENTSEPKNCVYGEGVPVVLVGDSHAAQWLPAIQKIGEHEKWKIITFTKSGCPFSSEMTYLRKNPYVNCNQWYQNVLQEIKRIKPKYLFTSQFVGHLAAGSKNREDSVQRFANSLSSTWKDLARAGIKVIAIRDTPNIRVFDPADCVAQKSPEECSIKRVEAFNYGDPILEAARITPGVILIDLSDSICRHDVCRSVEGNVLVYRDVNHLTATYVRSLTAEFYSLLD